MKKLFAAAAVCAGIAATGFEYNLVSGDYDLRVDENTAHTIRSIDFKNYRIGSRGGYYGSVLAASSGKYVGAGHTEGGRETVISIRLTVDGTNETPRADAVWKGKKIVLEKVSSLGSLLMATRLELTPAGLIEQKRFVAEAEQPVHSFYAQMYCWDRNVTDFLALSADGKKLSGTFSHEKIQWHVNSEVKYVAVYNSAKKIGMLIWYPQVIPGAIRKAAIWEVPKGYNKFYMMARVPSVCPKGYESKTFTAIITGFEAPDATALPAAVEQASKRAAETVMPALMAPGR